MSSEKPIDERFVRSLLQELCRERRGQPHYECVYSTRDRPVSWEQCAKCIGSSFIGPKGFYKNTGFYCPNPGWSDSETQEILNACLQKSLLYIDWLLQLSKKRYRDHASHQLFVATLGWFLLHCSISATDQHDQTLKQWITDKLEWEKEEDVEIAWWISSLLHDHGYPLAYLLQVTPSLTGAHSNMLLDHTWAWLGCGVGPNCENDSLSSILEGLYDRKLLSELREVARDTEPENRRNRLGSTLEEYLFPFFDEQDRSDQDPRSCYDHGMVGAANLAALLQCDRASENRILRVAIRAIGIHNGAACRESVSVEKDPLAFLLILCDELQEWGRRIVVNDEAKYESQQIRLGNLEKVGNEKYNIGECLTAVFEYPDAQILNETEWNYLLFRESKEKALRRLQVSCRFPIKRIQYHVRIPHEISFLSSETF